MHDRLVAVVTPALRFGGKLPPSVAHLPALERKIIRV